MLITHFTDMWSPSRLSPSTHPFSFLHALTRMIPRGEKSKTVSTRHPDIPRDRGPVASLC